MFVDVQTGTGKKRLELKDLFKKFEFDWKVIIKWKNVALDNGQLHTEMGVNVILLGTTHFPLHKTKI